MHALSAEVPLDQSRLPKAASSAGSGSRRPHSLGVRIAAAARRLGIQSLRAEQRRIIEHVADGGDALVVLPTGYGKSVCYQVPSLILSRPVVVVSPLLALIREQSERLARRGVPVVRVDSTVSGKHRSEAFDRIERGGSLLVMTTAESLASDAMRRALGHAGISLLAVDEAHTASEWGHDFRPAYLRLGEVIRRYDRPPIVALTATATEAVRRDVAQILGLRNPLVIAGPPDRPNLSFEVIECAGNERLRALTRLVFRLRRPGIVYCATTKDVDAVHGVLARLRVLAHRYHGRMKSAERKMAQDAFMRRGYRAVMVATSAFGLGIDKPDIRYVVHFQSPASLEQYVQEAGRAGRDRKPADCVLLYSPEDRPIHEYLLSQSRVRPDQLGRVARALGAWEKEHRTPLVAELATTAGLARRVVLSLVAVLEESGLVALDTGNRVVTRASTVELLDDCRQLGFRLERFRKQDAVRLDAIASYATTRRCRAQQFRDYFGVSAGAPCGVCDVCRRRPERPKSFFRPLERRPRKRRKRRRGPHARQRRVASSTRRRASRSSYAALLG